MTLSRFPTFMPRAAEAVIEVAQALRFVRDSSGDLVWQHLNAVQEGLFAASRDCAQALQEGAIQPASSEEFMASLGGPATLADFQAGIIDVQTKAAAWNALLKTTIESIPTPSVITLVQRGSEYLDTWHIERVGFVPAAQADVLRGSTELADLIGSFEAVGA